MVVVEKILATFIQDLPKQTVIRIATNDAIITILLGAGYIYQIAIRQVLHQVESSCRSTIPTMTLDTCFIKNAHLDTAIRSDIDISNLKKEMERALKKLKEDIKRTETAQNFMKDIFDLTGNQQLATDLMISVYGKPDKGLEESMKELLSKSFTIDDEKAKGIQRPDIANAINEKDVVTLRKYLQYVVDDNKAAAEEILDTWEKEEADWLKNLYKSYEKARSFDERKQLVRDREQKTRDRIDADKSLSADQKTAMKNSGA